MTRQKDPHELNPDPAALAGRRSGTVPGNQVTLLHNAAAFLPAVETACNRAQSAIYLETYILGNDATGTRITDALKRAVARGVNVHLLIDGFGSKDLPRSVLHQLRADGVNAIVYRPGISPWTFQRQRLRRMHRKIAVVDREIAFVGGINLVDDQDADGNMPPRYDFAVAVQGPLVDLIHRSAAGLWTAVARRAFRKAKGRHEPLPISTFAGGTMRAAFLVRDNLRHRRDIETAYLQAIRQAKFEIILAHAYFLPGHSFRHAMIDAAARGVRVILVVQGRVEILVQHYASRALYGSFLDAGVEIYEYCRSFLHAKVAVIDRHWATVGSSNIDPFSLLLSLEANLVIDDEAFGDSLSRKLMSTVRTDCRQILSDGWRQQPARLRLFSWLCYGLLRLMQGISGYAGPNNRAEKT